MRRSLICFFETALLCWHVNGKYLLGSCKPIHNGCLEVQYSEMMGCICEAAGILCPCVSMFLENEFVLCRVDDLECFLCILLAWLGPVPIPT